MVSVAGRALGFIRRQKRAFKVNIVRNVIQYFSLGLTYQYQSVYISELGASAMEIGYVNSVGGPYSRGHKQDENASIDEITQCSKAVALLFMRKLGVAA